MKKRTVSCWSVSWVMLSILFLCTAEPAHSASDKGKQGQSQSKETEAKQDKRLTQKLDMKLGFKMFYPPNWSPSPQQYRNAQILRRVEPDKRLSRQAREAPSILITTERRKDHQEAVQRLKEIDSEQDEPATFLEIGGWPGLKRRYMAPMERPGTADENIELTLRVTVAIAADNLLIRVDGVLIHGSDEQLAEEIEAIAQSAVFPTRGSPKEVKKTLRNLRSSPRLLSPQSKNVPRIPSAALRAATAQSGASALSSDDASPGLAQRLQVGGGVDAEIEIAVSTDGQNIVVVNNGRDYATSNDGGQSFSTTGIFPAVPGGGGNGDPSITFGASGAFYTGFIGFPPFPVGTPPPPPPPQNPRVCSTGITNSTDNGVNFNFVGNATQCDDLNGPTCFPDQEHIAADRFNLSTTGQDQVYSTWRNFSGGGCNGNGFAASVPVITSLVCSSDSGQNWGAAVNVGAGGDFPRLTVGQDGFVYVVYRAGNNLMINKFSNCDAGLVSQAGFPTTIAAGISRVTCPVPGLDRCNNGNDLTSQTVAVNDTDPNHIYVAYAVSTAGNVNENILVQDSLDGGLTWLPARVVQLNSGAVGRRFMPWICATGGSAYVSWYDMRGSSGVQNDVADFYGGGASLDGAGNLVAGREFKISEVSDQLCASGWPCAPRSTNDSESCSVQPQLAGVCQLPAGGGSGNRCDFSAGGCPAGETCQTGGGCPKYGDYNGSACAAGRFYTAWASATSPPNITPASTSVDTFFSLVNFNAPQVQVPGDVYLGDFCVGSTNVKTLEVCNTGKADLSVDPITSSSPDFAVTTPSSGYPVVISPDFCFPFEVLLTPNNSGPLAGTLTIPSNDTVNPSVEVDVTGNGRECIPQIQVPGDVHLGGYCVGDIHTETLNVCNTGKENLTVNPIISSDPADFAVTTPSAGYPVVISPDFCFPFEVVHTPTGTGPLVGTLTIPSDDLMTPAVQVDVTGTGNAPDIRVTGSTDFGVTSAWQPAERTVAVCNIGQCDLSVLSATVDFACADFTLIDNPFPATLRGGACLDLPVQFTPTLPGSKTCELAVTSNDPDAPTVTRTLKARTPPAVSFHTGFAHPYGALNTVADAGPTATLAFRYPLGPSLAWDVRLGFANFNGSAGRSDTNLWTLGANIKYTLNPAAPLQVFFNGGPGLYHFDPGNLQFGLNVGVGLNVPITRIFSFEATYNYHHAFTSSPNMHFDLFQLGFVTSF